MANAHDLREIEQDPRLFLYTSLTAGSSHIITATSRMETILKANRVPFQAIDIATDEPHRKLWQRRANGKKLPGLVKDGFVIADLEEVEEWNEYGELKENIGPVPAAGGASVPAPKLPVIPTATAGTTDISPKPAIDTTKMVALPGAAEIKARNNPLPISSPEDATLPETMSTAPAEKEKSIEKSIRFKGEEEAKKETVAEETKPVPEGDSAEVETAGNPSAKKTTASDPTGVTAPATSKEETTADGPPMEANKAESTETKEVISAEAVASAPKAEEAAVEAKESSSEPAKEESLTAKIASTQATETPATGKSEGTVTEAVETGEIDEAKNTDESAAVSARNDVAATTAAKDEPAAAPATTSTGDVANKADETHQSKDSAQVTAEPDDASSKAETQSPVKALKIDSEDKPAASAAAEPSGATESVKD